MLWKISQVRNLENPHLTIAKRALLPDVAHKPRSLSSVSASQRVQTYSYDHRANIVGDALGRVTPMEHVTGFVILERHAIKRLTCAFDLFSATRCCLHVAEFAGH
jgi:hypothetical protein